MSRHAGNPSGLMRTPMLSATALAFCALVVSSLRGNAPDARGSARADATVAIRTFQFAPDTLRVKAGTRVVWTNADEIEHTITSGTPARWQSAVTFAT